MSFVTANGLTVHYAREGNAAGPALVFINSLGTDLRLWDDIAPHFNQHYQLIRYDKRGHGLSDCPPAPYTIADHAHDLAGLLDVLGVEAAALVGISVGGMIALQFSASWPERVAGLVLCDTGMVIGTAERWNARIDRVRQQGMESVAEAVLNIWFAPAFARRQPATHQGFRHMLTRCPGEGYAATCGAIRDADLTAAAAAIKTPALVLCGAEDQATPAALGRALAEQLADGRFELIAGAAHFPCVEQPAATAQLIAGFLKVTGYV